MDNFKEQWNTVKSTTVGPQNPGGNNEVFKITNDSVIFTFWWKEHGGKNKVVV